MEVRIRYLSYDIAEQFGSRDKREVVHLADDATYEDLLGLLEKKYGRAESEGEVFDTFFFVCGGQPLRSIGDSQVNPDMEVLIAHKVFGGCASIHATATGQ
ncbi:MAG: hypothetical protein JSW53_06425 [Candidatus Bathyarchaeota archaeon]|nr:MAG: hypothetical protein JSW53_06425 [Candidatus Bathyarchaeota archaeon]